MEQEVAYSMMIELSRLSHIYEQTISDCFYSVCHKHNISAEQQQEIKECCIERVRKALEILNPHFIKTGSK